MWRWRPLVITCNVCIMHLILFQTCQFLWVSNGLFTRGSVPEQVPCRAVHLHFLSTSGSVPEGWTKISLYVMVIILFTTHSARIKNFILSKNCKLISHFKNCFTLSYMRYKDFNDWLVIHCTLKDALDFQ